MEITSVCCAKGCHMSITLIAVAFVYAFSIASCGASLITTPSNKAVTAGQRMEMECQTGSGSIFRKWDFLPMGSSSTQTIAKNDNINIAIVSDIITGFGVYVDPSGSVILYSNSTETKNAGVYICQGETGSAEFKHSAQLIVFESEPICETNLTATASLSVGDYIWMQCRVNFSGNWEPTMEWRQHPLNSNISEGNLISDETNAVVIQNTSITSTLIVLLDSNNYYSNYSCRTYFTSHNGRLKTNATNRPEFSCTWTITLSTVTTLITMTTNSQDKTGKGTTTQNNTTDLVFLLFGVLSAALFLTMLATVAVCCVIIRRKTAAWMATVVSTYENRERPRSIRSSHRFSTLTLRLQRKTMTLEGGQRPDYAPSEGYTTVDELTEECNEAIAQRPPLAAPPKYSVVFKTTPSPAACETEAHVNYSLAKDEALEYATLRKGIEPPKCDSDEDKTDSDSEIEDLK